MGTVKLEARRHEKFLNLKKKKSEVLSSDRESVVKSRKGPRDI